MTRRQPMRIRGRCSAPARWARRSPRTSPTPASPSLLLDLTADIAREGLKRAAALKPDPFFTPERRGLITTGGFERSRRPRRRRTGSSKRSSSASTSSGRCSSASTRCGRPGRSSLRTRRAFRIAALAEGPQRRLPPPLARHAFLQPAALSAAARGHPDAGDRSGGRRARVPVRGSSSRQGRRGREGHAELHRQSHRPVRRHADAARARIGRVHDRGDRRDHRSGARPAEERDVPDDGHRRHRRPRPRRREPANARRCRLARCSCCRRSSVIERGWIGEKAGQGFYKREGALADRRSCRSIRRR